MVSSVPVFNSVTDRVIVPLDVPTQAAAIAAGTNHLVLGRPITEAPDPAAAFESICQEIAAVV